MDTIADMLTILRNAQAVKKETVSFPYSNLKFSLVKLLESKDLVDKVEKRGNKKKPLIVVRLKYEASGLPKISTLKRISKPGQRIYIKHHKIKKVRSGYGVAIISTPKGVLTGEEARKEKVGGEYICEIW